MQSGRRHVPLLKHSEHLLNVTCRNSAPCVAYRHEEHPSLRVEAGANADRTLGRELERIAHEVEEDLHTAAFIIKAIARTQCGYTSSEKSDCCGRSRCMNKSIPSQYKWFPTKQHGSPTISTPWAATVEWRVLHACYVMDAGVTYMTNIEAADIWFKLQTKVKWDTLIL